MTNTLFNAKPTSHLSDSITVIGQLQSYPENDTIRHEPKYFRNYVYVEGWGYSPWFSINYARLIPSYNMLIRIGTGGVPYFRGHTVDGEILNAFIEKQFSLTEKFFIGFGIGGIYEYDRSYDNFLDPFYTKLVLNRYSASLSDDRLYYGLSLYYIEWVDDWSLRPAVKLGFSF